VNKLSRGGQSGFLSS